MKAIVVFAFVGSPLVAVAVAVMRASDETIDNSVSLLTAGVFAVLVGIAFVLAGVAVRFVLEGMASHRQAQFPAPSHQIDARRQVANDNRQISQPAQQRAIEELT